MPTEFQFPIGLVHLKVGRAILIEPLFFPEFSRLAADPAGGVAAVTRAIADALPRLPPVELLQRRRAATGRNRSFSFAIDPPRPNAAWRTPVRLRFHAAVWDEAGFVGQPEAVDLVADLLVTVKAGLARPNRPVASLMFVGPTGVGKTEMAKALAEFLFGSADRLTRFDMSE